MRQSDWKPEGNWTFAQSKFAGIPFGSLLQAFELLLATSVFVAGGGSKLLVAGAESSADRDASHGFAGFGGPCGAHNAVLTQ